MAGVPIAEQTGEIARRLREIREQEGRAEAPPPACPPPWKAPDGMHRIEDEDAYVSGGYLGYADGI